MNKWYIVSCGAGIIIGIVSGLYGRKCSSLRRLIICALTVVALVGVGMCLFILTAIRLGFVRAMTSVCVSAVVTLFIRIHAPWRGIIKWYRLRRSGLRLVP